MEIEIAISTMKRLQAFFGKKLSPEAFEAYIQEFKLWPDTVFRAAATKCQQNERTFPTINILKNYAVEVQREINERLQRRAKFKSFDDVIQNYPRDSEYLRESLRIFERMSLASGDPMKLRRMSLVDEMLLMDKTFPGYGWKLAADELKIYLEKRGIERVEP